MNIFNNWNRLGHLQKRGEVLLRKSTNRYLTTVKIAFRAKQRRFDDFDGLLDESTIKPVQRSIIELRMNKTNQIYLVDFGRNQERWRLLRDFKKANLFFD